MGRIMKRKLIYTAVIVALVSFIALGTSNLRQHDHLIRLREIQLQDTGVKLKNLNEEYNKLLNESQVDDQKLKQLEEEKKKLEEQLQAKLQKQEAERVALQNRASLVAKVSAAELPATSGTCSEWIAAAGITDIANAVELIKRESGCRPSATNPSSGACGVAQELPCGKSGCARTDGACQVRWMNSYVIGRYGSWAAAVSFHNANNWY